MENNEKESLAWDMIENSDKYSYNEMSEMFSSLHKYTKNKKLCETFMNNYLIWIEMGHQKCDYPEDNEIFSENIHPDDKDSLTEALEKVNKEKENKIEIIFRPAWSCKYNQYNFNSALISVWITNEDYDEENEKKWIRKSEKQKELFMAFHNLINGE